MAEKNHREELVDMVREGTLNVARDYYLRLAEEGADVDDLRKAMEIGAKVMGALQPEKTDNLLQVSWTINGGAVTFDAKQTSAPLVEQVESDIIDVAVKTLEQAAATPEPDPTSKFEMVDNLLDSI